MEGKLSALDRRCTPTRDKEGIRWEEIKMTNVGEHLPNGDEATARTPGEVGNIGRWRGEWEVLTVE